MRDCLILSAQWKSKRHSIKMFWQTLIIIFCLALNGNLFAQNYCPIGTNYAVCEGSSEVINLPSLVHHYASNGQWIWGGTGPDPFGFHPDEGTFVVATTRPGIYRFEYHYYENNECPNEGSTYVTITVLAKPNTGSGIDIVTCDALGVDPRINLYDLLQGESPGGVWTEDQSNPHSGTFHPASGRFDPDGASGTYVFHYTIDTQECPPVSSTVSVTVQSEALNPGSDATFNVCSTSEELIDLFSLIEGEDEGGVWLEHSNPSGGVFSQNGTFDVQGTQPGGVYGFEYTFPSNCNPSQDASVLYISISPQEYAGEDTEVSICPSNISIILLDQLDGTPDPGGTWSASTNNPGGGFTGTNLDLTPNSPTGKYHFTYTFFPSGGCDLDEAHLTIHVIEQPSVGIDGATYLCQGSLNTVNLFSAISQADMGGQWTDLNVISSTYPGVDLTNPTQIDFSNISGGIYLFEYINDLLPGCSDPSTSIATVVVGPQPVAGPGGTTTTCSGTNVDITGGGTFIADIGGTWLDPYGTGLDLSDPTNVDFSNAGAGTFSFTYAFLPSSGCTLSETNIDVIILEDQPQVGDPGDISLCSNSEEIINLNHVLVGSDPGGSWVDLNGLGNAFDENTGTLNMALIPDNSAIYTFEYAFGINDDCANTSTTVTVHITQGNNAGTGKNISVCATADSEIIDLFDLIDGEDLGGLWNISGHFSGAEGFDGTAGTFDLMNAPVGVYFFNYIIDNATPCSDSEALASITIEQDVTLINQTEFIRICPESTETIDLNAFALSFGNSSGGVFSQISGPTGFFNEATGIFDPTGATAPSTFVIDYEFLGTSCNTIGQFRVRILVRNNRSTGVAEHLAVCEDVDFINLEDQLTGENAGGTWLDDNNTGIDLSDPSNIDISTLPLGRYSFTYKFFASGTCDKQSTTIYVSILDETPDSGNAHNATVCMGSEMIVDLHELLYGEQLGGNWTDIDGTGIDISNSSEVDFSGLVAGTYNFTYSFDPIGSCANPSSTTATVTISGQRDAGMDQYFTVCDMTLAPISIATDGDIGGNWTASANNPPGLVLDKVNGTFQPQDSYPGTYCFYYIFSGTGGCPGDSAKVTVYVNDDVALAEASGETGLICNEEIVHYDLNSLLTDDSSIGGVWTALDPLTGDAVLHEFTGILTAENMMAGLYEFKYDFTPVWNSCEDASTSVFVELMNSQVGHDGNLTICDHDGMLINLLQVLGISDNPANGLWEDLDGAGILFSNPGAIDFSGIPHGIYRFKLSINDPAVACSPDYAIATVEVSSQPEAGVGGTFEICSFDPLSGGDVMIDLHTLLSDHDPGGVWTGPQPDGGGNFDPQTGILTINQATIIRIYSYKYSFNFSAGSPCDNDEASIQIVIADDCGNTTPCFASQRFNVGSSWNEDGTIDDGSVKGGIVKCGDQITSMQISAATEVYDPELFMINVAGRTFYDPYNAYMMTLDNPQVGEDVIWINFDVRAFVSSFELLLDDDEHLGWALYRSNVSTSGTSLFTPNESTSPMELSGDCSSLTLIRSGVSSNMWNTINLPHHQFESADNFYLAIWDRSDNVNIGDGPNGGIIDLFSTRMGCEETDMCSAPVVSDPPEFLDNKDGTYSIFLKIDAVNGTYEAIDKTGQAISISDPVCLTNSSHPSPQTRAAFTLVYPNNVKYEIHIAAMAPAADSGCSTATNYEYCSTNLITPPEAPLQLTCETGDFGNPVYNSFEEIPAFDPSNVMITTSCGVQDFDITYGDIIRQTGVFQYEVERVYTVFAGCQLPAEDDDQYATCSVFYTVDNSDNQYNEDCGLACNINGVNVGINNDCEVLITADMVLEGEQTVCLDNYYIVLTDPTNDNEIVANPVNRKYIGKNLRAEVFLTNGSNSDNSCWGYVKIEDKLPPVVYCPKPDTISCNAIAPEINFHLWAEDACSDFHIEILEETLIDYECDEYSMFVAKKTITYRAVDASGNKSYPCEYEVYYKKDIIEIEDFPEDITISCKDAALYDEDGDGSPDPSYTGAPMLGGRSIFPNKGFCKIESTFEDQIVPVCHGSYKILRKWTVLDWCRPTSSAENNPFFDYQIIKVEDELGPQLYCGDRDMTANSEGHTCHYLNHKVRLPDVEFSCTDNEYSMHIGFMREEPTGDPTDHMDTTTVYQDGSDWYIGELPFGKNWVICKVYDGCGKSSWCSYTVDVEDHSAPIPVCDEHTTVTLTNDHSARVYAETFDDGSFDFCSDVTLLVRRQDDIDCDSTESTFKEYVDFCCADIGKDVMVILQVTDAAGNSNSCLVTAEIVDQYVPTFNYYPPHHYNMYCGEDISVDSMGMPQVDEDCGTAVVDYEDINGFNQCGVGEMIRRWTIRDHRGNIADSYDQHIHVKQRDPFRMESIHWPTDFDSDESCMNTGIDPEDIGQPDIDHHDNCKLIAMTHEDQQFDFVDDVCFKVLRKWTVIDWCQYVEDIPSDINPGVWKYTQTIKISNTIEPVFDAQCMDVQDNGTTGNCSGSVVLTANVTDDCTPVNQIKVSYVIQFEGGTSASGTGITYNSTSVPFGNHTITWRAEDQCGNLAFCSTDFLVEDDINPTPYCIGEITTVVMPSAGYVDAWAKDFDLGSFDNCIGAELTFKMRKTSTNDELTDSVRFTCDEAGMNAVEIWVFDSSGNGDFCTASINVQAHESCEGDGSVGSGSSTIFSGFITTEDFEPVQNVNVSLLHSTESENYEDLTKSDGTYAFADMPMYENYHISAEKNNDFTNGVSTLDMVLMQKHILGTVPFDSPYKVIAADVNNNQNISSSDLVELRRLVLGLQDDFPNNTSWRFVSAEQEFEQISNPWPIQETLDFTNVDQIQVLGDYIGVKVGDVNGSVTTNNFQSSVEKRSSEKLKLSINNKNFKANEIIDVPISIDQNLDLEGFQITLNFDVSKLKLIDVSGASININPNNINAHQRQKGMIAISWNESQSKQLVNGNDLFILRFKTKKQGDLSHQIKVSQDLIKSEAYSKELEIMDIEFILNKEQSSMNHIDEIELFQNEPNPFHTTTEIPFTLIEDGEVEWSIFDTNGTLVYFDKKTYEKGFHSKMISLAEFDQSGVFYYQISTRNTVKTKKMIKLK